MADPPFIIPPTLPPMVVPSFVCYTQLPHPPVFSMMLLFCSSSSRRHHIWPRYFRREGLPLNKPDWHLVLPESGRAGGRRRFWCALSASRVGEQRRHVCWQWSSACLNSFVDWWISRCRRSVAAGERERRREKISSIISINEWFMCITLLLGFFFTSYAWHLRCER